MRMGRFLLAMRVVAVGIALAIPAIKSMAHGRAGDPAPQSEVVLTKLTGPSYPPLALQTRVTGEVELILQIEPDGRVQSATVVRGHPLLTQAALDSALHSQFECRNCGPKVESYRILYSFGLGPTRYCTGTSESPENTQQEDPYPRLIRVQNHVTIIEQPVGTCDLAFTVTRKKVRSAKCLYLWRCSLEPRKDD